MGKDVRRVDSTSGTAYSSVIAKAADILGELLNTHPNNLEDSVSGMRVHTLADESVNLITRPWVRTADYWDLVYQAKERFDAEGVNIPFPQRVLYVSSGIEVRLAGAYTAPSAVTMHQKADQLTGDSRDRSAHAPGPAIADGKPPADGDSEAN